MNLSVVLILCACVVLIGASTPIPEVEYDDQEEVYIASDELKKAVKRGDFKKLETLILNGEDVNSRVEDDNWNTLLMIAAARGYEDIAAFLLEYGADPELENDVKWTAMDFASQAGYEKIVDMLIKYGAFLNLGGEKGYLPLHRAVAFNHKKTVKRLLRSRANVHYANDDGLTPLHIAAELDFDECAEMLLQKHADVNAKDNEGRTPLDLADPHGKVVKVLSKYGSYYPLHMKIWYFFF